MLQCTGAETSTIWKEEIKKLHDWMTSQDLYPVSEIEKLEVTDDVSGLNHWIRHVKKKNDDESVENNSKG